MIRIEIHQDLENQEDITDYAIKKLALPKNDLLSMEIVHRSLDARKGHAPRYVYQLDVSLQNEAHYLKRWKNARAVEPYHYALPDSGTKPLAHRPVVIGCGPCGMAAALFLAKAGYRPILLERGPQIDERKEAVETYWKTGVLDPEKNVQFGEGGAGAFSDGKLTTRIKDPRVRMILNELIQAGADPSIAWMNHPHIGTDHFRTINKNIRNTIIALGGEVRFNTKAEDFIIENNRLVAIRTDKEEIACDVAILAIGHSARDTFQRLYQRKIDLQSKPFAIGVRVEHLQQFINDNQYDNIRGRELLPPAEYRLAHTSSSTNKGVYSFCMCPGGYVIAGASTPQSVVTNGMSYHDRGGKNANSAIVAQVFPGQDYGTDLFDGMHFQETLEHRAYAMGNQKAPGQLLENYLNPSVPNTIKDVLPTYPHGIQLCDLHALFSDSVQTSLTEFFHYSETVFPGFTTGGALLTGVETRTSSPLRIVRDMHSLQSNIQGLYPAGEGAGYAGGIVSAMIDGVKCAEEIIKIYRNL